MSTSIDQSFVRDYQSDVKHAFQRKGTAILNAVRYEPNITGKSTTFQRIGAGTATTKGRHAIIPPMNQDHTPIECMLSDFYAGDYVDKLDELKVKHNERRAIAEGGAMALGRKIDDQLFDAMDTTSQSAVTWTLSSVATARNGALQMLEALWANDVPNDGQIHVAVTPRVWSILSTVEEFASADFVGPDGLPLRQGAPVGRWKPWNGGLFTMHTGLPGAGTNAAKCFAWHKQAVGYASGMSITADITWEGPRASYWVNHMMSGGACLIDDAGVIEGAVDDTSAIPST